MYPIIFLFIDVILFFLIRLIAKRWRLGYILGGLIYGIYNEFFFEFCWDYSPLLAPMLWRDVPLGVVIGWGLFAGLALSLSDRVAAWIHSTSQVFRLACDVIFFSCIGFCIESIMPALNFWSYNFSIMTGVWYKIAGYLFVGILVSSAGRMIQALFMQKKYRETII
jgi:hypothetical protein